MMDRHDEVFCADIVMCIDATAGMAPIIDKVKESALSFWRVLADEMEGAGYELAGLRVQVIVFRDYKWDFEPMVETEFFVMPEQEEELRNFVNGIEVRFNTGYAGNAREAIALALKSNWTTSGWRRRHIVLVFSNEPALPLGKRSKCPNYPVGMPKDICELMAWWEGTWPTFEGTYQPRVGYMAAFTPPVEPWVDLQVLNRYYCLGNADVDYASLIDVALLVFGDF